MNNQSTQSIVQALRALPMSQAAIAADVGVTQGAISHIETGRRKDVRASTHVRLEALLSKKKNELEQGAA